MSYSFNFKITNGSTYDECASAIKDAANSIAVGVSPVAHQEANGTLTEFDGAIAAACQALPALLVGLGRNWVEARVAITGHHNVGNLHRDGWSNDVIGISAQVISYKGV